MKSIKSLLIFTLLLAFSINLNAQELLKDILQDASRKSIDVKSVKLNDSTSLQYVMYKSKIAKYTKDLGGIDTDTEAQLNSILDIFENNKTFIKTKTSLLKTRSTYSVNSTVYNNQDPFMYRNQRPYFPSPHIPNFGPNSNIDINNYFSSEEDELKKTSFILSLNQELDYIKTVAVTKLTKINNALQNVFLCTS